MAGRIRSVWRLARVALLTMGVLVTAGRGCGSPVSAMEGPRPVPAVADTPETVRDVPRLTVRVYNYARLNEISLGNAEQVAGAIFAAAGVGINWMDCPVSQVQYAAYAACQTKATPMDIDLKILPRRMAEKLHIRGEPLGFAWPCSDSDPACEVTIFSYMVDHLATYGYRADAILGHAIAHEIAHVLVGGAHSEHGIMRGDWSRSELQRMSWGILLCFSDEQSEALRAASVRREMAQQRVNEEASVGRVDLAGGAK